MGNGTEGYLNARGAGNIDFVQVRRIGQVLGQGFKDDVELVPIIIDHGNGTLSEGTVQRAIHLLRQYSQLRRFDSVDNDIGLKPLLLLVGR